MNKPRLMVRWITAPARRSWRWFAHQPRALQIGLIAVLLAALAAGTYYGQWYLKKRGRTSELAGAWSEYVAALRKSDIDGMREALDHVLAVVPNDPTATRHKLMIDRGEADPDAPDLARELLQHHIRHDRLNEAAREAEKVLANNPKDWQARCAVAHHALQVRKDRALAEQHLAQLPDPEDPAARANAGGLLYALRLSDAVGRDGAPSAA